MARAAKTVERELKFELSAEAFDGLAGQLKGRRATNRLRSVYFDTPGGDLRVAGYSLRIRDQGEGGRVQTLKWHDPLNPTDRSEWEGPAVGETIDCDLLADTPAAGLVRKARQPLSAVFAIEVERTTYLKRRGASRIELALDRGEILAGPRREPICELELELKAGDPGDLYGLARDLLKKQLLVLGFESKSARGHDLIQEGGGEAHKARLRLTRKTTVRQALNQIGWACLGQIAINAKLVRRRGSIEAVHQARVGLRRLRAALTAFAPMIGEPDLKWLKAETRWLARELDAARDLDVFIQDTFTAVRPAEEDRPAFARLGARLLGEQTKAYRRAVSALESGRYARLLLAAATWLETGSWRDSKAASGRARDYAADQLDRLRRKVLKRADDFAGLDEEHRHRLRIAGKKLRYVADFFAGCFGEAARKPEQRFRKSLSALQDELGALNDIAVAHLLAADLAKDKSGELGLAAGLAVGARQAEFARRLAAAAKALGHFRKADPFWR